jgi:hypothetical protein
VLKVPVVAPLEPCSDGSWVMAVKMFGWAARSSSAWPSAWTGVGAVKPSDRIRDPVTMISVSAVVSDEPEAGAVWALAAPAAMTIATALVASKALIMGLRPRALPVTLILHPPIFH